MATTTEPCAAVAATAERREWVIVPLAARRAVRGAVVWGVVFAALLVITGVGYTSAYPTEADRIRLAQELTDNPAFDALVGPARQIHTVGGFVAYDVGRYMGLIAAAWGFLIATRLLRGEEDEGRWDTLLSGPVTRVGATTATLAGIAVAAAGLWVVTALGALLLAVAEAEVAVGPALYLVLTIAAMAPAFAAVGAFTSQLATSRRVAAGIAGAIFAVALLARVASDSSDALQWMRWATPFGWAIELRPFADPQPAFLVPMALWAAAFSAAALALARGRDVGRAILELRSDRRPYTQLLGSPLAVAVRAALGGLAAWVIGLSLVGLIFGLIAHDVAQAYVDLPDLEDIGIGVDMATADGYLAMVFLLVGIAVSIYAATHVTAWREDESHGRLDVVLAKPHGRREWLGGRIGVAVGATAALAILAALSAWLGTAVRGSPLSLWSMLETGANMVPLAVSFLGVGILLFGLLPRLAGPLLYGLIAAAYIWELTGSIVDAPTWALVLSPFHHLALVPAESLDATASGLMLAIGVVAGTLGMELFRRRDLIGP
jgi:ABC-2 type transport system permease protein